MTKILPTVGRVVWFTSSRLYGDGLFTHIDSRKPLAAIVAHVFRDDLVNLAVFDSNGITHGRTSVPLVQQGEANPEHGISVSGCPTRSGRPRSTPFYLGLANTAGGLDINDDAELHVDEIVVGV